MALRFVIIGGGPAGNTAATHAARLGAEVTVVEKDVVGGAAHLWDCIPSKAMIATGGALAAVGAPRRWASRAAAATVDPVALRARIAAIEGKLEHGTRQLLDSQGVRIVRGTGRLDGPHTWWPTPPTAPTRWRPTPSSSPPAAGPACRSGPTVDGDRVLSTRDAYPPADLARAPRGDRLGGDRGRVRAHVLSSSGARSP